MPGSTFFDLLDAEADRASFDAVVEAAVAAGAAPDELAALVRERDLALQVRELISRHRQREAELTALYETANDLTAIRDVDLILVAIVRRARLLLHADMTYLSLNDEEEGASYMKVTDGSISAEFRNLRLPLGTGLLGLVAQTGAPHHTDDYQSDERFLHRDYIDHAVADEGIRAILGVPLLVDGKVIGALLATHRRVRPFPPNEVTLLTSFAAHAAIALENARLFEQVRSALDEVDAANRQIRAHSEAVEVAASAHDRMTDVVLRGGGVDDVASALADLLGGTVCALDPGGRPILGSAPELAGLDEAIETSRGSGRSVRLDADAPAYVVAAVAGGEHLGTLVLTGTEELARPAQRTLERGALLTSLVLLFTRTVSDAEHRVRGELLHDALSGRPADLERLAERALRYGANLDQAGVVAVAVVGDAPLHPVMAIASAFAGQSDGLGGVHDGHAVVVCPGADAVRVGRALRDRLVAGGVACTVGVEAAEGIKDVARAHAQALQCASTLLALRRDGEVSDAAGLGLARLVLGGHGPEELDEFIDAMLGPLLRYDARRGTALVETVEAWFDCGGRAVEVAERLHIHPNTVAQRLTRVGRVLGAGWRDPARALDHQMALRLWRLRAQR